MLSNEIESAWINRDVQRDERRSEFFINRRRNLKSNEKTNAKDIFIAYAKRSTHDSIENFINAIKSSHDVIQSKRAKEKTKLSNEVTIYDNQNIIEKFLSIITEFNIWKEHDISVVISSENHMSISLKSNWADKIKSNRIYSLRSNERVIVDEIFDNLHFKEKMKWFTNSTSFDYFVFVIYRIIMKNDKSTRKERAVIDIRRLNAIIVTDAYFMSAQTNIIVAVTKCLYIFVINVLRYFYQWAVKFDDRHKLTIISHRKQEQFNVLWWDEAEIREDEVTGQIRNEIRYK
jgi:uncharacterized protein (UPF0333 family)